MPAVFEDWRGSSPGPGGESAGGVRGRIGSCIPNPLGGPAVAAAQNTRSRSTAALISWREAVPAPVVLVSGPEEYLGIRAMDRIRRQVREATPDVEVSKLNAGSYDAGALAMNVAPSLFGGGKLIEVEGLESMNDAFLADSM